MLLSRSRQFTCTYFRLTVDDYVDLLEFVDDKQIEIGFDNWNSSNVVINKDGEILQSIRDYLFLQGEREITN